MWVVNQDQLNSYEAYEGYVVRFPHNPLLPLWLLRLKLSLNSQMDKILRFIEESKSRKKELANNF